MKILITVSAVVFLMILTTGLATAKKVPVPTFPFTATGDTFRVNASGNVFKYPTEVTVYEIDGLFYGTINFGAATIAFSAVLDSAGVYTLHGIEIVGGALSVTGKFTITYVKHKGFETAIQFGTIGSGESFAGTLSQ